LARCIVEHCEHPRREPGKPRLEGSKPGSRSAKDKATIGPKLVKGQSPDYFDSLCMALANDGITSFASVEGAEQICF
jgi:hypothetical protein